MNVATIEMPVDEAKQKLNEYLDGLHDREPSNEDRGIVLGLKALAKGKSLIDLASVMKACPITETEKLPKLAVACATWRWCHAYFHVDGRGEFYSQWSDRGESRRTLKRRIPFGEGTFPAACAATRQVGTRTIYNGESRALVPLIPPNLRPYRAVEEHLILFEAEWQAIPPRDPMLLRPLAWPLCVVVAHWDLTELERAVLAGRLTERR